MTVALLSRDDSLGAVAQAVFQQVRRAVPPEVECEIALDSSLSEIGLDSITRMEVLNRLEEAFRVRFTEDSLYDMETCRDVVEYIEAKTGGAPAGRSVGNSGAGDGWPVGDPGDGCPAKRRDPVSRVRRLPPTLGRHGGGRPGKSVLPLKERVVGATATIAGREVISYTSFDYLGMGGHPQVVAAAKAAHRPVRHQRLGQPAGGRQHTIVQQLDEELARFLGVEAAVVFPSGYGTNASVFGHLFGAEDLILYDELAHNSIVQGTMLSKAQRRPFPHNDLRFRRLAAGRHPPRIIAAWWSPWKASTAWTATTPICRGSSRSSGVTGRCSMSTRRTRSASWGRAGRGICEHFGVDPARGRHLDGHHQQGPGQRRRLPRRPGDSRAIPEVHDAGVCLRHRPSPRPTRPRPWKPCGDPAKSRTAWNACGSGRGCS